MNTRDLAFSLDTNAAQEIITTMAAPVVRQSAEAIAARAKGIIGSISHEQINVTTSSRVGTIRRGVRAISTVTINANSEHQSYIGFVALSKSKDAGRV